MEKQINDQMIKKDAGKPRLSLVPTQIVEDIARVREFGNKKYTDPNSWKQVEPERYRDALYRHLLLYLNDPYGVDDESGLPHLSHIACNVAFLCELDKPHRDFVEVEIDGKSFGVIVAEQLRNEQCSEE